MFLKLSLNHYCFNCDIGPLQSGREAIFQNSTLEKFFKKYEKGSNLDLKQGSFKILKLVLKTCNGNMNFI